MKKIIYLFVLFVICWPLMGDFMDHNWSINFSEYRTNTPWHDTAGPWKILKIVKFKDGYIIDQKNRTVGRYWFTHPTNLIIKIDSFSDFNFYGSFHFMDDSSIVCGTGETWKDRKITCIKIVLVRSGKCQK